MDHLSSTILMCAILLLFYATGTVKGVAFGADCTNDCTDDNNECTNGKCACTDASYRNTPNNACVTKVVVNGTCISTDSSTEQCSKDNSECSSDGASGHRCYCTSAYYDATGTCTLRKKPADPCGLYQCVANAMCSTTDDKCACNTHYIAKPTADPTSCESTGFGGTCSVSGDCTQTNNVCTSNKCACSGGSFRNVAGNACVTKVAVNGTCISTETSADQCSGANSGCSSDGASGHKCFCTSDYYDASGTCTLRKKPTEGCELYQCVANATCSTPGKTCACNTGYKATATSCEIVAFGDSCTIDIGCGEDNNVCSNSTCVCSDTSPRNAADNACVTKSDAATIMLAHMHVFIFGTVASLYFLV